MAGADKEKDAIAKSLATVEAALADCAKTLHRYDEIQQTVEKTRVDTTAQLLKLSQRVKSDAKMADFSADVLTSVGTGLSKLCVTGAKAATLKGAELAAANKEIMKQGLHFAYDPLQKAWGAGLISFGKAGGAAVETAEQAANWLHRLAQPSWWAEQLTGGSPADKLDALIKQNNKDSADLINTLKTKRAAVQAKVAELQKVEKTLQAKAKAH